MDINNVKKEDLEYFGYREELPFASSVMVKGWFDMPKLAKVFGLKHGIRWFQANYNLFEVKEDVIQVERDLKEILENKGKSFVIYLNKKCLKAGKELIKFSKKASKETLHKTDKEKLISLLEDYSEYLSSYTIFMLLAAFEKPIVEIAKSLVEKEFNNPVERENLLRLITTASRQTTVEREQFDFLKIASRGVKDKTLLTEKHAKKYGWLAIRYFLGDPWTADSILARLESINSEDARKNLKNKLLANKLLEKEIAFAINKFSKEEKDLVKVIREVVYLRNQRADFFSEAAYYAKPFLERIAVVLEVSYKELLNLCIDEIILALKKEIDYKKEIEDRMHGFVIFHNPEKRIIYGGKMFNEYIKEKRFLLMETSDIDEFKGTVAFKGSVCGAVKIVKAEGDLGKVKKDDILVCPMTVPHFISAMEKASAFVTDEGGITCHAAIIAREMRKPCIIGTKIATKVLKDGDLVEVDAERGVVRILEKKNKIEK